MRISFAFSKCGATENLILAAAGAVGRTILRGAAKEPEIIELCQYLQQMGVLIEGVGTDVLTIKGTSQFVACDYNNVYDRIVAGTYLLMAAAIPCDIKMKGIDDVRYMANVIRVASQLGAQVVRMDSYLEVQSNGWVNPGTFQTGSYPEFPTDLQPVLVAALLRGQGISYVEETVFEKRFSVVSELRKLGAEIEIQNQTLKISGGNCLQGHTVKATDLRQGAALVLAGLISKGYTTVTDISYIERGYEDIVEDLRQLGAKIQYI